MSYRGPVGVYTRTTHPITLVRVLKYSSPALILHVSLPIIFRQSWTSQNQFALVGERSPRPHDTNMLVWVRGSGQRPNISDVFSWVDTSILSRVCYDQVKILDIQEKYNILLHISHIWLVKRPLTQGFLNVSPGIRPWSDGLWPKLPANVPNSLYSQTTDNCSESSSFTF